MKRFRYIYFLIFFGVHTFSNAQSIYLSTTSNDLYRLNIETCTFEFLTSIASEVFDITFHPNGQLYGVSGNGSFFEVDTVTGAVDQIHKFDGQFYNSLTTSADGIIYTTGSHEELWSYDLSSGEATFHGETGFKATGDLTFYDGQLYAAVTGNRIALIDIDSTENSIILIEEPVPGEIFGIVSFTEDCSEINSYAITDEDSDIYLIDFENNTLDFICELDIEIGGGASTFEFLASAPIIVEEVQQSIPLCSESNGSITIIASGGTGGIQYSLDGENFTSNPSFQGLEGGEYSIFLVDDTGCVLSEEISLPTTGSPEIMNVDAQPQQCDQIDGFIMVSASGGTGNLLYSINGMDLQDSSEFSNLSDGMFAIEVVDELGCIDSFTVVLQSTGLPQLNLETLEHTTCNMANGMFEIETQGGAPQYQYSIDGIEFQSASSFEELIAGGYQVIVVDSVGCRDSLMLVIDPSEPPLILPIQVSNTRCNESNGSILIENTNSSGMALFSLNGMDYQSSNEFLNLDGGQYLIYTKDERNCISLDTVDVLSSEAFLIGGIQVTKEDCNEENGRIEVDVNGGTEPIIATLNEETFVFEDVFDQLESGIYDLILVDAMDCTIEATIELGSRACPIYMPNIISPNNDGVNDFFQIKTHPKFEGTFSAFRVFDRWGSLIYELEDFVAEDLNWDATLDGDYLSNGVYSYYLEYIVDGSQRMIRKGDVTIIK